MKLMTHLLAVAVACVSFACHTPTPRREWVKDLGTHFRFLEQVGEGTFILSTEREW